VKHRVTVVEYQLAGIAFYLNSEAHAKENALIVTLMVELLRGMELTLMVLPLTV